MHITTTALMLGSLLTTALIIGLYAYGLRIGRAERDMQYEIQLDQLHSKASKEQRKAQEHQHIAERYKHAHQDVNASLRELEAIRMFDRSALVRAANLLDLAARTFDAFSAPQAQMARELRDECRNIAVRIGWEEGEPLSVASTPLPPAKQLAELLHQSKDSVRYEFNETDDPRASQLERLMYAIDEVLAEHTKEVHQERAA